MAESKALKNLSVILSGNKNKTYTFGIITVVVVLVLLFGAIQPTILTISKITTEVSKKKTLNQQLDAKINAITKLGNDYEYIREDIDYLPLLFPTQGNFSLFLSNIDVITKESGFNLVSISFSADDKFSSGTTTLVPWGAKITVSGSRANLIQLMEKIEAMPMAPVINNVSFSRNKSNAQSTNISLNIIIYRIDDLKFYE